MTLTIGSLFSGIGGLELGLERAGLGPVVWQVEQSEYCRAVLAKHWPDATRYEDVRDVGRANLVPVDVICGGFPCQDISYAGKGAGLEGERSGLWFEFARIVREMEPRYVVVENVSALLTRGLDDVLGTLADCGYDAEWSCVRAFDVGAPHLRDRLFIVAYPRYGSDAERTWAARREGGQRSAERNELGRDGSTRLVAHAEYDRLPVGRGVEAARRDVRVSSGIPRDVSPRSEQQARAGMADSDDARLEGLREERTHEERRGADGYAGPSCVGGIRGPAWWAVEPGVGRVAHGVPARVDRLKSLGNAVVPQVAEVVGRVILDREMRGAA